jgi:phosphoribosyl-AMP cyclohydrolase
MPLNFTKLDGLLPAVVQDADSGEVLMVGFMNEDALKMTKLTGFATFYSRTRKTLWTKGETSGNKLAVQEIFVDCDEDTVLLKVKRLGQGNVCHTGARTCFTQGLQTKQQADATTADAAERRPGTGRGGAAPRQIKK